MDRLKQQGREIVEIKTELKVAKEKMLEITIAQIEDRQFVRSLYEAIGDVKQAIKELTEQIQCINQAPAKADLFKDTMLKFAIDVFRVALAAGIVYGVSRGFRLF